jgi:flagellar protein FlaG
VDIGSIKNVGIFPNTTFLDQSISIPAGAHHERGNEQIIGEDKFYTQEELKKAIDRANKFLHADSTHLKYTLHEKLGEYFVQLIDNETNEVVREIPPKKILDFVAEMQAKIGLLIDERR